MRLNRFLAAAGLGSRRSCEQLVASGRVVLNGRRVDNLATVVGPGDDVRVDGRPAQATTPTTLLLNKPRGYVVTRSDERGRRTVYDLLEKGHAHLFHVGRLDKESEGLLLMTNDGALAQLLAHPSHGIEKEYEVRLDKSFDPALTAKLLRGVHIEGGRGRFESVRIVGPQILRVVLKQGLKRQIRLMLYRLGYEVERLRRVRMGPLFDTKLPAGAWRPLSRKELDLLAAEAKPKPKPKPRRSSHAADLPRSR